MGFFDLLAPFFLSFDEVASSILSPLFRVVFWALFSAVVSNLIFKWLSNPVKISNLKIKLKNMQVQLNRHDGEFAEFRTLAINTIKVAIQRMGLTFLPAMYASIPILFVLTYISNNYGLETPKISDNIGIKVNWEESATEKSLWIRVDDNGSLEKVESSISWPEKNHSIKILDSNKLQIVTIPIQVSPILHKQVWWNSLVGNPAGYLPQESGVSSLVFDFKELELVDFGPRWLRGWMFAYFTMTILFSIILIALFKIKF